jgi:DNA repair exonuclease SbcCD ATPase subunit
MTDIQSLRHKYEYRKGIRDSIEQNIDQLQTTIKEHKRNAIRYEKALEITKHVGLQTQKQLEYRLAEQVSLAMEAIFDDPYQLKLNFQEKRGRTEVEILFTRRDLEFPPLGSAGGGTIDVASLALRIAYWSMRQDKQIRPLLLLDEPFSQLKGEDANRRALAIIKELSEKLNLQIIMISDERVPKEMIIENAHKVMVVEQKKGVSQVHET